MNPNLTLMDKKYTVFISSTYADLQDERKQVIEALLQMNCFPIGMEYFNAADDSQWNVIKSLIKESDYYLIIIAGRYGSIESESGKSYTQKEYEYAMEQGIPILRFIYYDTKYLTGDKLEETQDGRDKLSLFTEEAKKQLCKFWHNPGDLTAQVVLSLNQLIKASPRIGWIRGDAATSEKSNADIIRLKDENEEFRTKIKQMEESAPVGIEYLSQGDDHYAIHFDYVEYDNNEEYEIEYSGTLEFSWNELFSFISPHLVIECEERAIRSLFENYVKQNADIHNGRITRINVEYFQNIKIQFMALGLIKESNRKKSPGNKHSYWTLTPYGNKLMMKLKAIKK